MHFILNERKNLGRIEKYSCISFLIFLCLCVLWDVWVWWPGSVTRCRCQLQPGCCRTHGDCSTARCGHRLDDCSCRQHSFLAGYWSNSAPTACSTCSKIWHADTSFSVFSTAHAALFSLQKRYNFPALTMPMVGLQDTLHCPEWPVIVAWREIYIFPFSSHDYPWLRVNFIQFSGQNWKAAIKKRQTEIMTADCFQPKWSRRLESPHAENKPLYVFEKSHY